MKLFKDSRGFVIAFGFNVAEQREDSRVISWCDPTTKEWTSAADNQAGWVMLHYSVAPEFVFEVNGDVVAYQPGRCIRMSMTGAPYVWCIESMSPDEPQRLAA